MTSDRQTDTQDGDRAPKTSHDVTALLRRHYLPESRPPAGIFAPEVMSPCGQRRADLLWAPVTTSGAGIEGHEIKVSRSDVLAELSDGTKADAWLRYCERWWLVVSAPALIDGLTIPEQWGVMSPPSGRRTRSMTVLRPAPRLKPVETGPAYRRINAWLFFRQEEELARLRHKVSGEQREAESWRQQYERISLAKGGHVNPHAERVSTLLRLIEAGVRENQVWGGVEDGEIVAACIDAARSRRLSEDARDAARRLVRDLRAAAKPLDHLADELAEIAGRAT